MQEYKYIIVPKNDVGMREIANGYTESENIEEYKLTIDEFIKLDKINVFEIINNNFHKLIDEGEEETVTAKQLEEVYMAISIKIGSWLDAVNAAIRYKTCIYMIF